MRSMILVAAAALLMGPSPSVQAKSTTALATCSAGRALCQCAAQVIEADFAVPSYAEHMGEAEVAAYLTALLHDPTIQARCKRISDGGAQQCADAGSRAAPLQ